MWMFVSRTVSLCGIVRFGRYREADGQGGYFSCFSWQRYSDKEVRLAMWAGTFCHGLPVLRGTQSMYHSVNTNALSCDHKVTFAVIG